MIDVIVSVIVFLTCDIIWISANKKMYGSLVHKVQNAPLQINMMGAVSAYALMIVGLIFIVFPLVHKQKSASIGISVKLVTAIIYGGIFGLVVYGIYNATNYAILHNYDLLTGLKDTVWGITVYSIGTFVYLIIK